MAPGNQKYGSWYTGRWYSEEESRRLGGAAARPGPRGAKCNSTPINGQCTNHRIADLLCFCGFNVPMLEGCAEYFFLFRFRLCSVCKKIVFGSE